MNAQTHSQPKQTNLNHFVARFTSRPWLLETSQFYKLWIEKTSVHAKPAGPKSWGGEENLYSQNVEDAFEKIETRLAHLQRKLEDGDHPTEDERYGWSMWLLASYLRTPAAFLCSAQVSASMQGFAADLFRTSYSMLATCVINPHCIELIANRDWQILTCEEPYFLKPDSGMVLTDRLDKEDCLILYPLSPFSCFLATGNRPNFRRVAIQKKRVFGLNKHILRWAERSVACTTEFWESEQFELRHAVQTNLGAGQYSPPTSGQFFTIEALKCGGKMQATILAPRGPIVMTVAESAVRPVTRGARPKIPGLYDVEGRPNIGVEIRYSGDDDAVDYGSAASFMMHIGQKEIAVDFARKALQKDENDLLSKLIILTNHPMEDVGDLAPRNPDDAAGLAEWWARSQKNPLEGLKITSIWLRDHPDHQRLARANFLCAFMVYGARFFQFLCGKSEKLPYLDDKTPLPDGVIDFIKRVRSHSDGSLVSDVQRQVGNIDLKASGLAADILKVCGLDRGFTLYRKPLASATALD